MGKRINKEQSKCPVCGSSHLIYDPPQIYQPEDIEYNEMDLDFYCCTCEASGIEHYSVNYSNTEMKESKNEKMKKNKTEQGKCPNCGCDELSYSWGEIYRDKMIFQYSCEKCGSEGKEIYLNSYEHSEVDFKKMNVIVTGGLGEQLAPA